MELEPLHQISILRDRQIISGKFSIESTGRREEHREVDGASRASRRCCDRLEEIRNSLVLDYPYATRRPSGYKAKFGCLPIPKGCEARSYPGATEQESKTPTGV